jgi:hypothetical protein
VAGQRVSDPDLSGILPIRQVPLSSTDTAQTRRMQLALPQMWRATTGAEAAQICQLEPEAGAVLVFQDTLQAFAE